jgi:SARP family transcriptional regulator, regulator of embCAB operon
VLGPLQICVDGTPVPLGTPKQRAVLAMLLINRNRPVGIEALIDAAWEQWPPPGARASLHSYVFNLRKILDGVGIDSRTALASAPPGYRLTVAEMTAISADSCSRNRGRAGRRGGKIRAGQP